nr:AI-2E family transporter [Turicibacter sp.]
MRSSKESLNYTWINYLMILVGIWIFIQIIKLITPLIQSLISMISMIICPFFIALCLAYLLNPLVNVFCRLKIKRSYSILLTFISIAGAIFYAIFSLIPYWVINIQEIINRIPALIEKVQSLLDTLGFDYMKFYEYDFTHLLSQNSEFLKLFSTILSRLAIGISSFSSNFMFVLGMIFLVPVVLYFILNNFDEIRESIKLFLFKRKWKRLFGILKESEEVVKGYISGTLLVSLALSVIASIYFALIGLDNVIVFGTLIGFLNIIPYVGQIIGTIPAAIFGLMVSVWTPVY